MRGFKHPRVLDPDADQVADVEEAPVVNLLPAARGIPVDVKEVGIRGAPALLQDVHPPWVLQAGRHVVGHDVEKKPHATAL